MDFSNTSPGPGVLRSRGVDSRRDCCARCRTSLPLKDLTSSCDRQSFLKKVRGGNAGGGGGGTTFRASRAPSPWGGCGAQGPQLGEIPLHTAWAGERDVAELVGAGAGDWAWGLLGAMFSGCHIFWVSDFWGFTFRAAGTPILSISDG